MSVPQDFNADRRRRIASERRFNLGPYTFKRRASIPPEVLAEYANAGRDGNDGNVILTFEKAIRELIEPTAVLTATAELDAPTIVNALEAWDKMRLEGDENDVVSFDDLTAITQWLISSVTERPTGAPSDSPDSSATPSSGTPSTASSSSEELTSSGLTLVEPSTPSTPS